MLPMFIINKLSRSTKYSLNAYNSGGKMDRVLISNEKISFK